MIYLDHAASAPLRASARDAWIAAATEVGNASSVHGSGQAARRLLEDARVAALPRWFPEGLALLERGILVVRHEIEYRAQLDYRPEPVAIDLWVTRIGGAGYDLGYVVRDPHGVGTGTVYAVAETSMALFDFAANAPRRATALERDCLAAQLGGPAPLRKRR